MITCPNCKNSNLDGTLFCAECGSQLAGRDPSITQTIGTGQINAAPPPAKTEERFEKFDGQNAWGSLHVMDTGGVIPLAARNEFTLGRISEGQPIMPDIDLSPYQAYAHGVSRLHAVIKRAEGGIILMDLGSANGTYYNGRRLAPNVEQLINHGDVISLGKLKLQILLKLV